MMNSHSTSRVVIGIGLAVVFAVGASVFAVRAKHQSQLANTAPAPALVASTDQNPTDATPPTQSAATQTPTDQTAAASSAPPAVPPADAAGTPASDESTPVNKPAKSKASDRADRHVARTRNSGDATGTRVASAASSNTSPTDASASNSSDSMKSDTDTTSSAPAGMAADSQQAPAQTAQQAALSAAPPAMSNEAVASDGQITANVKSEIATAAPNSNVDVTTTNGIVALAGSLPSQAAVDQARQAAQRVAGVKHVDASALMISNQ